MKKIIVFGGTFNPIHIGHTEMLAALTKVKDTEKILLMPDKIPPHKTCDMLASDTHRLNMCKILADRFNNVTVSLLELDREGKSYTIDTVKELKALYPDHQICITIGGDMLASFDMWKDYDKLLRYCKIICFSRVGIDKNLIEEKVKEFTKQGADIILLDNKITEISSSFLRENIGNPEVLRKYLDEEIFSYVFNNNIYGE